MASSSATATYSPTPGETTPARALEMAAFQRIAMSVQDDMMVAMLSTLQTAASVCAQICLEKMHALQGEILRGEHTSQALEAAYGPTQVPEGHLQVQAFKPEEQSIRRAHPPERFLLYEPSEDEEEETGGAIVQHSGPKRFDSGCQASRPPWAGQLSRDSTADTTAGSQRTVEIGEVASFHMEPLPISDVGGGGLGARAADEESDSSQEPEEHGHEEALSPQEPRDFQDAPSNRGDDCVADVPAATSTIVGGVQDDTAGLLEELPAGDAAPPRDLASHVTEPAAEQASCDEDDGEVGHMEQGATCSDVEALESRSCLMNCGEVEELEEAASQPEPAFCRPHDVSLSCPSGMGPEAEECAVSQLSESSDDEVARPEQPSHDAQAGRSPLGTSSADAERGSVVVVAAPAPGIAETGDMVACAECGDLRLSKEECRRYLRFLSNALRQPRLQQEMSLHRSSPMSWPAWPAFVADVADKRRAMDLRTSCLAGQPVPLRELLSSQSEEQLCRLRGARFRWELVSASVRESLKQHCADSEVLSSQNYHDLLLCEGQLDEVPLERLEVASALGLYPSQVSLLVEGGREEFGSLQALRTKINQVIVTLPRASGALPSTARPWGTAPSFDGTTPHGLPDPREWTEESLLGVGYRTIELLQLQDIVEAAEIRLTNRRGSLAKVHRALILAGACGPALLEELMAPTDAELLATAASCRLNACFSNMGLGLLSKDTAVVLRSRARLFLGKACKQEYGVHPCMVTAPHNILLMRKRRPPRLMEESTTCIAERVGKRLRGCSLTWSRRQQFRMELKWAIMKQRGWCDLPGNESGLLDPSMRDPNAVPAATAAKSEWRCTMAGVLQGWRKLPDPCVSYKRSLHVDIHGCQDPPKHTAHLNVGLGAMSQVCADAGVVQAFGQRLAEALKPVVASLKLSPKATPVCIVLPADPADPPALAGAWKLSSNWRTQTQLAMSEGFTHACHLEMSMALRRALSANKRACERLADALWIAFSND